jgi:hypothetical protein
MSSEIKANSIQDKTGTRVLASDSGSAWSWGSNAPKGTVLQVLSTQTSTYQDATNAAYVDIFTDLQMTTKGANKILVMGNINGIVVFDAAAAIRFNLTDGSSSIQTLTQNYMKGSGSSDDPYGSFGFQHLTGVLSASTAYTYNVEFKNNINGSSVRVSGDSNSIRTLTLMEIKE